MDGVSNIKFPRARITVFFVSVTVISVLAGAVMRVLFNDQPCVIYVINPGRSFGSFAEFADTLISLLAPTFLQMLLIYFSAFTMFPAALCYSVMIYRGLALGWSCALLSSGECVSNVLYYPLFYFFVSILIAAVSADTVFFANRLRAANVRYARDIPRFDLSRFTLTFSEVTACALLIDLTPSAIRIFFAK